MRAASTNPSGSEAAFIPHFKSLKFTLQLDALIFFFSKCCIADKAGLMFCALISLSMGLPLLVARQHIGFMT